MKRPTGIARTRQIARLILRDKTNGENINKVISLKRNSVQVIYLNKRVILLVCGNLEILKCASLISII